MLHETHISPVSLVAKNDRLTISNAYYHSPFFPQSFVSQDKRNGFR